MKKIQVLISVFLLAVLIFLSSAHNPMPKFEDGKIRVMILDAGHGGKDPGALGSSAKEKDITLGITKELSRVLKENLPDLKVVMTRDDDTFVELHKRAKHAHTHKADFFVSVHVNSATNKSAHGTETYVLGLHAEDAKLGVVKRENGVVLMEDDYKEQYDGFDPNSIVADIFFQYMNNLYLEESIKLAEKVETEFKTRVGRHSRGVQQAGYLVLWKASAPSLLIETGFISNKEEEKFLTSKQGQVYMASAIYRAIKAYNEEI